MTGVADLVLMELRLDVCKDLVALDAREALCCF